MSQFNLKEKDLSKFVKGGTLIPLYTEIITDLETPISLYKKVAKNIQNSFLLESAEQDSKMGRYSFIGVKNELTFNFKNGKGEIKEGKKITKFKSDNPLNEIRKLMSQYKLIKVDELPRFQGGLVGHIGYETTQYFEEIKIPKKETIKVPEILMHLNTTLIAIDHLKHKIYVISHIDLRKDPKKSYKEAKKNIEDIVKKINKKDNLKALDLNKKTKPLKIKTNFTEGKYGKLVKEMKNKITEGEIFQVVLSQKQVISFNKDPFDLYRVLRSMNPSPYMYYINNKDFQIIGASPETQVRAENNKILLSPIAGTRPRGADGQEDKKLADELLKDEKELAEHTMLLDLARNDMGRVANPKTVKTENPYRIEKFAHVMHIVSDVVGELNPKNDVFDLFQATFPAGTVSGAPKIRAMQIISDSEKEQRGIYAGAVGYFDFAGNMDFAIAIRTMVLQKKKLHLQAGAGIVFDSKPEKEHQECLNKLATLINTIQLTS